MALMLQGALWSPGGQAQQAAGVFCFAALLPCGARGQRIGASLARELIRLGHEARMMPPAYVKPYIRR
jgi:hypothetical protein